MLGKQIRQRRKDQGKTQTDVGRKLGVSTVTVSRWERTGDVPMERLPGLAEALEMDLAVLRQMSGHEEGEPSTGTGYVKSDADTTAWRNLVALDRSLDTYVLLLLVALPVFVDRGTWIVSVTTEAFLDRTKLNRDQVLMHWKEMIASPYVERIGDAEWVLRLKFPES